jgi:chemotaxis protein histidine kinase CheA
MSGSTILGNGEVALIVDVGALGDLAASDRRSGNPRTILAAPTERDAAALART